MKAIKVIKASATIGGMALILFTSSGFTTEVTAPTQNSAVETVSVSGGTLR